jgi:hypothetical protein
MKMAIMQPYFFPYIGYFQLIASVDRFILCDDVQYIRHGWINRNRILSSGTQFQYIILPVARHGSSVPIRMVRIAGLDGWQTTILRQLEIYRKKAPYYDAVIQLLQGCLFNQEKDICSYNGHCIQVVCDYIGIPFRLEISSRLQLDYSNVKQTDDWAITICRQLDACAYYNPPGGMGFYNRERFSDNRINLHFVNPRLREYPQLNGTFMPALSVIDVMMFNHPEEIRLMLKEFELI